MNKTKAILGFLANFLLGVLGVVGVGWLVLLKFPKLTTLVFVLGAIFILMCFWSAYDEMRKKLKQKSGNQGSGTQVKIPTEPSSENPSNQNTPQND